MKTRWLILSLALVAVAAVAAVVFSSQGSEVSNGLSKGILYQLMEFFGIEITAESVKTGNFLIRKAAHFTVYFVLGLGLTGAFHFQKKVPAWIPSLLLVAAFAAKSRLHPIFRAALFHLQFEGIHPFVDGNGRTGRLILNLMLMQAGYPPINVKYRDRKRYYEAFDAYYRDQNHGAMLKLVVAELKEQLQLYAACAVN